MLKKNTILFHEEDEADFIYMVRKGRVRISSSQRDGNEKQLYIAETGAICGEDACINHSCHHYTALAIVDSVVSCISCAEFRSRIRQDIRLMERMLEFQARKTSLLQKQVVSLSFAPASARIARTLIDLYQMYGEENAKGYLLRVPFTKSDIAGMIGTSRVTASCELVKMEKEGLLTRHGHFYMITDMDKVIQLANY